MKVLEVILNTAVEMHLFSVATELHSEYTTSFKYFIDEELSLDELSDKYPDFWVDCTTPEVRIIYQKGGSVSVIMFLDYYLKSDSDKNTSFEAVEEDIEHALSIIGDYITKEVNVPYLIKDVRNESLLN